MSIYVSECLKARALGKECRTLSAGLRLRGRILVYEPSDGAMSQFLPAFVAEELDDVVDPLHDFWV